MSIIRSTLARRSAALPRPWMRRPSPMLSPIGCARVEAGVRVLEDDLHPAPVRLERGALDVGDVHAVEADRPGRRLDEAQQQPADRRLAAARLADEAEGLAAADRRS